jgi:hypothetical protein
LEILESIDDYQIFHKMMKKKNASLNEAAMKILKDGPPEAYVQATTTIPVNTKVPTGTTPTTKKGEEAKFEDPVKPTSKTATDTKTSNLKTQNAKDLEKEQLELAAAISQQEQDEWSRKSMFLWASYTAFC